MELPTITNLTKKYAYTLFIVCATTVYSLHGMFARIARTAAQRDRLPHQTSTTIQTRTFYNPHKFKGLPPLTEQAKPASPLLGAAEWESGRLPRMYAISTSDDPCIILVQELFHQVKSSFRTTHSLSKAAFALTPGILGLVLGALISNKLHDKNQREYIIDEWQREYVRLTKAKNAISKTKINHLLDVIQKAYDTNKNEASAILISFLYAKANPESDHDILHYLLGLNHYIDIFIKKKSHIAQTFQKATQTKDKTIFEKLALLLEWLKKPILKSHTEREYSSVIQALDEIPTTKTIPDNFGRIMGAIINEKEKKSPYPPRVFLANYGYDGQRALADCFEATFHNLLNILLYNQFSQSFDISLLPSTIHVNEKLKQFYSEFPDTKTINSYTRGQAFMNLVSGLSEKKDRVKIAYAEKNYEIETGTDTENNVLQLMNYFFNLYAHNFEELGTMLSDTRRTIWFTTEESNQYGNGSIIMSIKTRSAESKSDSQEITVVFGFNLEHAWLGTPSQINAKNLITLISNTNIGKEYEVNPYAKALFDIQPSMKIIESLGTKIPTSMYYSFPTDLPSQKKQIILELLDKETVDKQSLDYAYSLYKQLSDEDKKDHIVSGKLIEEIIKSHYWISFKEFLADNLNSTIEEATSLAKDDQKYVERLQKWLKYKKTKDYKDLEKEQPFTETKEHLITE